jgi:two-component system, sensor histidine kinase and response regulator
MVKLNVGSTGSRSPNNEPTGDALTLEGERRLLIVDDEPAICFTLQKLFAPHYTLRTAESGVEALRVLREGFLPHVILADQRMPAMSGAEFLSASRGIVPHAVRIILTGYTDVADLTASINIGNVYRFLTKPWNNTDLLETTRLCFQHFELSEEKIALEAALNNVQELNREQTEIMGIISHDLKNPLSGIMGISEIIGNNAEQLSWERVSNFGNEIHRNAERMFALIKNLLDMNAVETGQLTANLVKLEALPIITLLADMFREQAARKNITIHCSGDAALSVLADEMLFNQVVENILSNAVKYSPHGKNVFVRVASALRDDVRSVRHYVRIEVQDEGYGISEDDMKRLFGKFVRLSAEPTGGEDSTGLGLSIVKKLVELMDGRIWCESEPGNGATFIVEFPAA